MYDILKGKKGIIFGALNADSIAWKVAQRAHEEGAQLVLTNAPIAMRLGEINKLAQEIGSPVIPADATNNDNLMELFQKSMDHFGGQINFILHSIGMSINIRKNRPYTEAVHEDFIKGMDISALSLHRTLSAAWKLDALASGSSVLSLSYIAAQRTFPGYGDMADNKAYLESITRSFGYYYGKRNGTRVNSISQSPTKTSAGSGIAGFNTFFNYAEKMSPLGNASSLECADYCITLFSDLTKKVTMQNLFHDGGFSFTGVSEDTMHFFTDSSQ